MKRQSNIQGDLLLGNVSQMFPRATFGQHVESNLLKATCCLRQLLSNFWETSCFQHVESNLFPKSCSKVAVGNKLLATSCLQHVAQMLIVCSGLKAQPK